MEKLHKLDLAGCINKSAAVKAMKNVVADPIGAYESKEFVADTDHKEYPEMIIRLNALGVKVFDAEAIKDPKEVLLAKPREYTD